MKPLSPRSPHDAGVHLRRILRDRGWTPVPFDRECAEGLSTVAEFVPPSVTPEMIPLLRQPNPAMPAPTNDDLQRGGVFTVEERSVRGPEGAPDVSLLICRPTSATAPVPVVYHIAAA